ncbi:Mg2+ transporter MgtE [Aneurinibacillus soli]|uniref:Magnesium transporter MgtE n=1 Tax=Aneurinibacillus soli TaxID=1500254 RepID=A0A0U5AZZ8_9BACL|nr:CBS domain-containing protein [Aneurinibacillus soli]PYE59661.1 Mg2+ transporter MgtE [Aneurinibacillus soli]BAU29338.1 Magnesium transporter MgtE [Aneurinibacillus soli]
MMKLREYKFREEYTYYMLQALKGQQKELFRQDFLELHPTDQMEFFIELDETKRKTIYRFLTPTEFGEIFKELEPAKQNQCFVELDKLYTLEMIDHMSSDDAADFLGLLSPKQVDFFLNRLEKETAEDIKQLLSYQVESAGSLMTTEFVSISVSDRVSDVFDYLRREGEEPETIYYLYVTDEQQQLVGVVSLRDLIVAKGDQQVQNIMSSHVITVSVDTNKQEVARIVKKYGLLAVPVVVAGEQLVGIITFDDILSYL